MKKSQVCKNEAVIEGCKALLGTINILKLKVKYKPYKMLDVNYL